MKYTINIEANTPSKENVSRLIFRIRVDNNRIAIASGLKVPITSWDNHGKKVLRSFNKHSIYNSLLNKYQSEIEQQIHTLSLAGIPITKNELIKDLSFIEPKEENTIVKDFKEFLVVKKQEVTKRTIDKYTNMFDLINLIAKSNKIKLDYESIDDKLYALTFEYLYNERGLQTNGANPYIKNLKVFLNWATEKGYNTNTSYKKFKVKKFQPDIFPLNKAEIKILEESNLIGVEDRVRDLFLFQVYTGLRYNDVQKLNRNQVSNDEIRIKAQKGRNDLYIPLTQKAKTIIRKYKNNDAVYALPTLNISKANVVIKKIAEKIGLDRAIVYHKSIGIEIKKVNAKLYENISQHDGRRSFISNNLASGIDVYTTMAMSGHKNFSSFERYVSMNEIDIKNKLKKAWDE